MLWKVAQSRHRSQVVSLSKVMRFAFGSSVMAAVSTGEGNFGNDQTYAWFCSRQSRALPPDQQQYVSVRHCGKAVQRATNVSLVLTKVDRGDPAVTWSQMTNGKAGIALTTLRRMISNTTSPLKSVTTNKPSDGTGTKKALGAQPAVRLHGWGLVVAAVLRSASLKSSVSV